MSCYARASEGPWLCEWKGSIRLWPDLKVFEVKPTGTKEGSIVIQGLHDQHCCHSRAFFFLQPDRTLTIAVGRECRASERRPWTVSPIEKGGHRDQGSLDSASLCRGSLPGLSLVRAHDVVMLWPMRNPTWSSCSFSTDNFKRAPLRSSSWRRFQQREQLGFSPPAPKAETQPLRRSCR